MSATRAFNITAMELANRAPTGATLTVAGSATSVTNPGTLGMSAAATDPDTGDMLTYTWSSSATELLPRHRRQHHLDAADRHERHHPDGHHHRHHRRQCDGHAECDGESDARCPGLHQRLHLAHQLAENTTAVGAAGFFIATGATTYSLTGADMARFTITNAGTLTFNTAPNFEMPRGAALSGSNTNNYTIGITARSSAGLTTQSSTITIQVTDVNEAPLFPGFAPPTFTEYSTGTITLAATDAGQTLTYRVNAPTHGATITGNTFTWTPGEDDGDCEPSASPSPIPAPRR